MFLSEQKRRKSFRLLTELYSFLLDEDRHYYNARQKEFPSPYGVSFILILEVLIMKMEKVMFPSPYRVIFILT